MKEYKVINYIEVSGKDVPMDSLPPEELEKIKEQIRERFMQSAGYKRKTA